MTLLNSREAALLARLLRGLNALHCAGTAGAMEEEGLIERSGRFDSVRPVA